MSRAGVASSARAKTTSAVCADAIAASSACPRAFTGTGVTVGTPEGAATAVSLGVLSAVLVVQLLAPSLWDRWGWVVLVAGLLLGLPHGAVDHLVPGFLLQRNAPRLVLVIVGYAATAVAAWAVFRSVPAVALTVFVVLSVLHFGAGEVGFDNERAGRGSSVPWRDPLAVLATGGAALLLPILREPATSAPLIALLVPGSSGLVPIWLTSAMVTLVLGAVVLTCVHRALQRRWLGVCEAALLAAVGLIVSPLAAFGAYFGAWHGLRHIARMVSEDPANAADLMRGRLARPVGRFALTAAAPTAVSLAALAGLWALAGGWRGFVTANLALLAGLTLPHVVVVAWADRHHAAHREAENRAAQDRAARDRAAQDRAAQDRAAS